MRSKVIITGLIVTRLTMPHAATAQGITLNSDTSAAVVAALRYARSELLLTEQSRGKRQHLINRAQADRSRGWSDAQLRVFGGAITQDGELSTSIRSCDSRARECPFAATTDIVTVGSPARLGDSVVVDIELEFPTNGARAPIALRGHRYMVVRKNGHWVVVKADMVSAT